MKLSQLLDCVSCISITGGTDMEITSLTYDSRQAEKGSVFVALNGARTDAHEYIADAVHKGALAVVTEQKADCPPGVTQILVRSTRKALAALSANYFGHPALDLVTIGITGTKGKTTTSYMIRNILEAAGHKTGLIGTIGAQIDGRTVQTRNTTPESYEIQRLLRQMAEAGCTHAVMEVSSQGLKQHRTGGFVFDYGIFLNISPDHIGPGEHGDFDEYLECKKLLLKNCRIGIVNRDMPQLERILENHFCAVETFGFGDVYPSAAPGLTVSWHRLRSAPGVLGTEFETGGILKHVFCLNLPGRYNICNALAAILTCCRLGVPPQIMADALERTTVPGRCELLPCPGHFIMLIDYAHNALSMESLLQTLREYSPKRLTALFGCGGDRPKMRRYDMGEKASLYCDRIILTTDNPRYEQPGDINKDILEGIRQHDCEYLVIPDRAEALRYCIDHAEKGDIFALIGKGHEEYQEVEGVKYRFSEREIVVDYLETK